MTIPKYTITYHYILQCFDHDLIILFLIVPVFQNMFGRLPRSWAFWEEQKNPTKGGDLVGEGKPLFGSLAVGVSTSTNRIRIEYE